MLSFTANNTEKLRTSHRETTNKKQLCMHAIAAERVVGCRLGEKNLISLITQILLRKSLIGLRWLPTRDHQE